MAVSYRTQVLHRNIASQFLRGGQGYRWMDSVKLAMHRACIAGTPVRSGDLAASHRSSIRGVNQYRVDVTIRNIAAHADWVHEGTQGARASGGKRLVLPPGGPSPVNSASPYVGSTFGKKRLKKVRGQNANPWLENACTRIALTRGAYRVS